MRKLAGLFAAFGVFGFALCSAPAVVVTADGVVVFDSQGFEDDTVGSAPTATLSGSWAITHVDRVINDASPGPFAGGKYFTTTRDKVSGGAPVAVLGGVPTTGQKLHIEYHAWYPTAADDSLLLENGSCGYGRITGGHYFNYDGAAYVATGITYKPNQWQKWEVDYTIGAKTYSLSVDGGVPVSMNVLKPGGVSRIDWGHNGLDTYYLDAATVPRSKEQALTAPQRPDDLQPMLKITWSRGPNLPQGYQDSEGGFIGDTLVSVVGFCSGIKEDNARKPGIYPRGFLKKAWGLDVSAKPGKWQVLPDFPGTARQGMVGAIVDEQLYVWGGCSYELPFTYDDGWKLKKTGAGWSWSALPKLPWKLTGASATVIDTRIYIFGGADYDGVDGFHTDADRDKKMPRLGARLLVFDTKSPDAGWKELPQCPGSPRFVDAMQAVNGKIYIIGGATGLPTYTVVDNWTFEPAGERWTRIRDLPIASGNFPKSSNLLFKGRYILLPGGAQYGQVINVNGTTRAPYGKPHNLNKGSGLYNDVFVYDIQTNTFGTADRMPIDNNLPMTVVRNDRMYMLGGETGGGMVEGEFYGNHPDLLLIGRMEAINP